MEPQTENPESTCAAVAQKQKSSWLRTGLWILLGCLLGAVCAALFFAYGQPALLLEQMNLRYCG